MSIDELREEAKEMGIPYAHVMGEEKLKAKIAEAKVDEVIEEAVEEVAEEVVDKSKTAKATELLGKAMQMRRVLGERDLQYLEHVSAYRDYMPEEYQLAKENIKDWL